MIDRARVLIVDDDPASLVTMQRVLALAGYDVIGAGCGVAALHLIEVEHFDLIVSDLRMPDVSGLELLAEVRERLPHLPMVLFSAFRTSATERAARQLGATRFLEPLWDHDEFLEQVKLSIHVTTADRADSGTNVLTIGPATRRWLDAVLAVVHADHDLPRIADWAQLAAKSVATLKKTCSICDVYASDSLDMARGLRIVRLYGGGRCHYADNLDIAEPRTMTAFLNRAGLSLHDPVPSVGDFLAQQQFVTSPNLLKPLMAILATHSHRHKPTS